MNPQGIIPASQQISDFQFGEVIGLTTAKDNAITLQVPRNLIERKLYCWIWADASDTTNFLAIAQLVFKNNNSFVGQLPVSVASASNPASTIAQSVASVCTTSTVSLADSLGLYVAKPTGSQPAAIILQPLYIRGEIDEVQFCVRQIGGTTTAIRAALAMISSLPEKNI